MLDCRVATVCEYRHAHWALLPLEGEGENEGRSKATDSYSDQTSHLPPTRRYGVAGNPLPSLRGETEIE